MSDRKAKLKSVGRSASTDSTEYSITMGKSMREKRKKPKERWLLTRKTWRYMADAGRKLIPDGASNKPEDIPKIEAFFQEVCRKEPKFLLWRKNSYPGAIGFRRKKKERIKGGSCRNAISENEVDTLKPERPKDLAIYNISGGRFDIRKMKYDFLNSPPSPTNYLPFIPEQRVPSCENLSEKSDEASGNDEKLMNMLEKFLTLEEKPKSSQKYKPDFDYEELVEKLQRHLTLVSRNVPSSSSRHYNRSGAVHFEGDHVEKSLTETLSRYFSQSTNRDKVISDLLTNRKALEKLYFELRKTKGFRGRSGLSSYNSSPKLSDRERTFSSSNLRNIENNKEKDRERKIGVGIPPPVIEIIQETPAIKNVDLGIQTVPIPETILAKCEEEYKKELAARKEDEKMTSAKTAGRRRSSVDNDDISQSVSDTIKRYLRMARKKSVDSDKADRFKRVNYDRNLRNIKPKGEITKPGDDDGLNKGCQTNEDWILTYRDLKFREISDDSRVSSSRSSIDGGGEDKSPTTSPPHTKPHHSFLSHFLHGKNHDKGEKTEKCSSSTAASTGASAMQKSKSSSSVMHHGSRLVAKKIFRTRSKSQTRASQVQCNWTPQGSCVWNCVTGRQVILGDTTLLQLSEIERKVLQKVAIAKLQALNLGVAIKIPEETVGAVTSKKRRPYLLKRKAITTSIFDASRKDGDKDGSSSTGLVFGIPLTQCMENDRLSRAAAASSPYKGNGNGRRGSRASFSSLIDTHRGGEGSSSESLMGQERMAGSVPGLLDKISCTSTADLPGGPSAENEEFVVPNILTACIKHIKKHGLHTLGIFRVSTSKKRIRELRESFDNGSETTLDQDQCPHDVATLLKEFLRDLPDPLLCRDLYHAFVQTQRIRNRRLQLEALQHLIQLLPSANRDTLHALLSFLSIVAQNSSDSTDELGEILSGNKMDSNNLATVFAPNILHCIKPNSSKETASDRAEDRIDIINVVRILIDHYHDLYKVPADLLDEIYIHMMDTHPEALDELLSKRDRAEESQEELDSESYSAPWSPTLPTSEISIENMMSNSEELPNTPTERRRMWSREECLHEAAATGGPNISMRIKHKDKIRERSQRKKREESASRKRNSDDSGGGGGFSSAINIISRLRGQKDDDYLFGKNRSSSLESSSSAHTDAELNRMHNMSGGILERRKSSPFIIDNAGVITASLTIPVQTHGNQGLSYNFDDDIPYIEDGDNGKQQLTIGVIKSPIIPPRRRQRSISGSDSSVGSIVQPITGCISLVHSTDSAVGSSITYSSPVQNTPTSMSSSIADPGMLSSPPSWASTPPTSPDSTNTSVNYIPDDNQIPRTRTHRVVSKDSPTLQRVTFMPIQEVQRTKVRDSQDSIEICKPQGSLKDTQEIQKTQAGCLKDYSQRSAPKSSDICKSISSPTFDSRECKEPRYTPIISNIGNAVLRSKTADFEKISKTECKQAKVTTTATTSLADKKKYTKRRYTDTRHPTRHIPDSESLELSKKEERTNSQSTQPVYKRRELISSVPSK